MKRTFTLLTALLFSFSLFAFTPQSLVSISSTSKYSISVTIDNRNCTENRSNDILIRDVNPGYHTINIYRENPQRYSNNRRQYNQQLVYSGRIYVRSGFHTDIVINRFGKAYIDERRINSTWYSDEDENCYDWNTQDSYREATSADEFNQFKQTISNSSFDDTKVAIAKQTINSNYFTAAQVSEIIGLFSFEDSKLDIAKSAYRSSIDKNNYFLVSDALGFSSSKEELAKFLETSR